MADQDHQNPSSDSIEANTSFLTQIVHEIINSPLNIALLGKFSGFSWIGCSEKHHKSISRLIFLLPHLKRQKTPSVKPILSCSTTSKCSQWNLINFLDFLGVITLLIYKIFKSHTQKRPVAVQEPELPKLRRDFTVEELRPYDGNGEDGRVLVAVNGNVYDVTKGKRFYGPGEFTFLLFLVRVTLNV